MGYTRGVSCLLTARLWGLAASKSDELSRPYRVDAGDGPRGTMLQAHELTAPIRNLWFVQPDSQGRGFYTGEYRGGTREKKSRRIPSASFNRQRIAKELETHLLIATRLNYFAANEVAPALESCAEIGRM